MSILPPWAIVHVPHDSTDIPYEIRSQFVLTDHALEVEILKMTDHHTYSLFAAELPSSQVVRAAVSRLVVDVERFERDEDESMSAKGMGSVYMTTHDGRPLRRALLAEERNHLLNTWYRPHHQKLTAAIDYALERYGRAIIIDAHSFPETALPYEMNQDGNRPEICIGADDFHTPAPLVEALIYQFEKAGLTTGLNVPFSGALVPSKHYGKDKRVSAVMIEVRRDVYLDETEATPTVNFSQISKIINHCIGTSIIALSESRGGDE
jgi:N-formylglutamate deformylase